MQKTVYLSGTQKNLVWAREFFFFKHAKLERITKFGMRERESWYAKKKLWKSTRERGTRRGNERTRARVTRRACRNTRPALTVYVQLLSFFTLNIAVTVVLRILKYNGELSENSLLAACFLSLKFINVLTGNLKILILPTRTELANYLKLKFSNRKMKLAETRIDHFYSGNSIGWLLGALAQSSANMTSMFAAQPPRLIPYLQACPCPCCRAPCSRPPG